MTTVQLIQGTHGWGRTPDEDQWWHHASPFATWLNAQDCIILGKDRPYVWDSDLDGLGWFRRDKNRHYDWEAAGYSLYAYLRPPFYKDDEYVPLADRNLIAHSHAMQVVAYACAKGLRINRLITIGSPVRKDMWAIYTAARLNITAWLHVHSDSGDRTQWFGELMDGHLGIVREQPLADQNVLVPKVGHSGLLNDADKFPLWQQYGLLSFLQAGPPAAQAL